MKKIKVNSLICWLMLLLFALPAAAEEPQWTFIDADEGVAAYTHGNADTGIHVFKSRGFVDARMEVLITVLRDVSAYHQWMERCEESITLKHIDHDTKVFYLVRSMPVFKKNREIVLETAVQYMLPEGAVEFSFFPSDKASIPINPGVVRLENFSGMFRLEFFGRDKTRVTYTCTAGPDVVTQQHVIETIRGLQRVAQQRRYIEEGLASPERTLVDRMVSTPQLVDRLLKNRAGAYFAGQALLDTILNEKKLGAYVHTEACSFESIQKAIAGIFYECLTSPTVKVYLSEKPLGAFLDIDMLLQERWLGQAVFTKEPKIAAAFFENRNNVFEKAMESEKAVNAVISDSRVAKMILTNASLRRRLANDAVLKQEVLAALPKMNEREDLGDIITKRVKQLTD
ncbi:MAG: START domain-containing protein [Thermodesulfobacteriota bacterium]|nr:START domain-containing protein [Thermodesulfobacteriota bacterium]